MRQRSDLLCTGFLHAPVSRSTAISIDCFKLGSKLLSRAWREKNGNTLGGHPRHHHHTVMRSYIMQHTLSASSRTDLVRAAPCRSESLGERHG
jgi:hypothetical protein